jgi:hypothetical protein
VSGDPVSDHSDRHPAGESEAKRTGALPPAPIAPSTGLGRSTRDTPAGVIMCNVVGGVFLLVGLYFLVVAPGMPMAEDMSDSVGALRVANFHRLAMGQAFTVAGAIFLAAAWRPRG